MRDVYAGGLNAGGNQKNLWYVCTNLSTMMTLLNLDVAM